MRCDLVRATEFLSTRWKSWRASLTLRSSTHRRRHYNIGVGNHHGEPVASPPSQPTKHGVATMRIE